MVIFGSTHCFVPAARTLALLRARFVIASAPREIRSATAVDRVPCNRLRCTAPPALRVSRSQMASDSNEQGKGTAQVGSKDLGIKQNVQARVHAVIADSTVENGWDQLWKEGMTPWDMGTVTPVIQDLIDKGDLPGGRALVPGCGIGYDVLALASENRHTVGLDISETVNEVAVKKAAENPKGKWVEFLVADFFEYAPEAPFNLIFDYTFFCAIDPSLRPAWAAKMADLLIQDGELITLMFPLAEFDGGPPFAVSIESKFFVEHELSNRINEPHSYSYAIKYEEVLIPHGFTMTSCKDNELAVGARKGREKIAHWTRKRGSSKF